MAQNSVRLPTIAELMSLSSGYAPVAIPTPVWSSTSVKGNEAHAWAMDPAHASVLWGGKAKELGVLLVGLDTVEPSWRYGDPKGDRYQLIGSDQFLDRRTGLTWMRECVGELHQWHKAIEMFGGEQDVVSHDCMVRMRADVK